MSSRRTTRRDGRVMRRAPRQQRSDSAPIAPPERRQMARAARGRPRTRSGRHGQALSPQSHQREQRFQVDPSQRTPFIPTEGEMEEWRRKIEILYPEWRNKMYFIPSAHIPINVSKYGEIAGIPVKEVKPLGGPSSSSASTSQASDSTPTSVASQRGQVTPTKQIRSSPSSVPPAPSKNPPKTSAADSQAVESARRNIMSPVHEAQTPQQDKASKAVSEIESDVRADRAQQRTLQCLQTVCGEQNEAMFIISQLKFSDFLCKRDPVLAHSAPKGRDRGDFDILIIHRRYGILIGEVKSVGFCGTENIIKTLEDRLSNKVFAQLDKSEKFVKWAVEDIAPNIVIRKTVILPYISSVQMRELVNSQPELKKKLCFCVGARDTEEVFQLCLLENQISGHSDSLDNVKAHLETWWQARMACTEDPNMSEDKYLHLLARFCGPATTVRVYCPERPNLELRTKSEGVALVGEMLSASLTGDPNLQFRTESDKVFPIMLTEDQFRIVLCDRKMVFVTGPPGTGKSIVLLLKGVQWLRHGHNVHVVSTRMVSFAACRLIEHQLNKMKSGGEVTSGDVYFHDYDFWNRPEEDGKKAIEELKSVAVRERELYVLMDEYSTHEGFIQPYRDLLDALVEACSELYVLYVWTAAVRKRHIPALMEEAPMVVPLRYPREVLDKFRKDVGEIDDIHHYDASRVDHLPHLWNKIEHCQHGGERHEGEWPVDCFQCGKMVGQILKDIIHNGGAASASTSAGTSTSPPPLRYSDVFVLTRSAQLQDASPFVQGLRGCQIPVLVLSDPIEGDDHTLADDELKKLKEELAQVARSENVDKVVVARYGVISGLERKVVVCLPGRITKFDDTRSMEELVQRDRIHAMSRSAAYLILIDMPTADTSP